jgi:hypothetical protein
MSSSLNARLILVFDRLSPLMLMRKKRMQAIKLGDFNLEGSVWTAYSGWNKEW